MGYCIQVDETMKEFWDIVDEHGNRTGRLHERGKPMKPGEYHLSVSVWIVNSKGEFLISKRTPNKTVPNMWETTGGSAVAGEDSLSAAIREVKEELGLNLEPMNGELFTSYVYPHSSGDGAAYFNVWIFRQDAELSELILQPEETADAVWADRELIREMIQKGEFINFSYIERLFCRILSK